LELLELKVYNTNKSAASRPTDNHACTLNSRLVEMFLFIDNASILRPQGINNLNSGLDFHICV